MEFDDTDLKTINKTFKADITVQYAIVPSSYFVQRGTDIRGLMRGMATLPQGNQELLVVRDKVGRPLIFFPSVL